MSWSLVAKNETSNDTQYILAPYGHMPKAVLLTGNLGGGSLIPRIIHSVALEGLALQPQCLYTRNLATGTWSRFELVTTGLIIFPEDIVRLPAYRVSFGPNGMIGQNYSLWVY